MLDYKSLKSFGPNLCFMRIPWSVISDGMKHFTLP
jgi:hypothetical protein